ncbi:hypothetical protein EVAR_79905_1 [Eumeta japonica]|uniref:DDE-1 domain-containing protein n=1 Tax=Eumeta variegata TaxID=151549 RepID=A0A4C1TZ14_EUMVA|nr:hypothetical protein EVAR_79905_1 [Eumeta japonica]
MLEVVRDNDVILSCLPSYTTSASQPLDRAVFGPLKAFHNSETSRFMRANPNKKLSIYNSGELVANAWIRAVTLANAIRFRVKMPKMEPLRAQLKISAVAQAAAFC